MQTVNTTHIIKDSNNSSTTVLLANGVFTGASVTVSGFVQVIVHCMTDVPTSEFKVEFSNSGVEGTWNASYALTLINDNNVYTINKSVPLMGTFMRMKYTNGAQNQNIFALSVFLSRFKDPELLNTVDGDISKSQSTNIVRLGSDYKRDIAMGKIAGNSNFIVNGNRILDVDDQFTTLSNITAIDYSFPTVARTLYLVSDSPDDVYGTGSGAWAVFVDGLDVNFNKITEIIALNGTTNSTNSTQEFIRVNNIACVGTGTYSSGNIGKIKIWSNVDQYELSSIRPGDGRSINAIYTIPAGYKCVIPRVTIICGTNHTASFKGYFRKNNIPIAAPYNPPMIINEISDFSGIVDVKPEEYVSFDEGTDFWVMAKKTSGTGTAHVSIIYDIDIIKY